MPAKLTINRDAFSPRRFANASKEALVESAQYWHSTYMPGHFKTSAVATYDYAPRVKPYMIRKARKLGHQRPLVFTGDSERQATEAVTFVKGTVAGRSKASARMMLPGYFVKHPNKGMRHIDKPDELTRTTPAENEGLSRVYTAALMKRLGLVPSMRVA